MVDNTPDWAQNDQSTVPDWAQGQPNDGGQNDSTSGDFHTAAMLGGDLLRSPVNAALGIVDTTARLPAWAYNTFRPDGSSPVAYPPSLNQGVQGILDKYLPVPQTSEEQVLSSGMRNAAFGPAGVIGGAAANVIQQQPVGQDNIDIAGRDIGVSPNDIASNAAGMLASGALSPKPLFMGDVAKSEAGRLAQINMKNDIPVYPTDVLPQSSAWGSILNFMNSSPLSGASQRGAEQSAALGHAVTGAMGEDSPVITPTVMNAAYKRLSNQYEDFGKNNDVSPQAGSDFLNKLDQLQKGPWSTLGADVQKRLQAQIDNNVLPKLNNNYSIDGEDWHTMQTGFGSDARRASDPEYSSALYDMQQASRGAMRQSIPTNDMAQFDATNAQYRAMLALEKATKQGMGSGDVSPSALLAGSSKLYPDTIYDDPNTIPQLAQSSQLLKQAQANSDKFNLNLHRQPLEAGQIASMAATPLNAVLNRTMNTRLTPYDFSAPWSAALGRGAKGMVIANPQQQHAKGGLITDKITHPQWVEFIKNHGKKYGYSMKDKSNPDAVRVAEHVMKS